MAERNASKDEKSAQDILMTEIIVNQALIDILIDKQIITEKELVNSIKNIRQDQQRILKLVK
jgi:hypothetical protein